MNQPRSCGQGLAERSALPEQLSGLIAAIADSLERHRQTLDLTDDNARAEDAAYAGLANDFRSVASQLQATANRMMGYRDLPMVRHDGSAMVSPAIRDAFVGLITREHDVASLLHAWIRQDEEILAQIGRQ